MPYLATLYLCAENTKILCKWKYYSASDILCDFEYMTTDDGAVWMESEYSIMYQRESNFSKLFEINCNDNNSVFIFRARLRWPHDEPQSRWTVRLISEIYFYGTILGIFCFFFLLFIFSLIMARNDKLEKIKKNWIFEKDKDRCLCTSSCKYAPKVIWS